MRDTMNQERMTDRERWTQDLGDIQTLRKTDAFRRYFIRRIIGIMNQTTGQILDPETGLEAVADLRTKHNTLAGVLQMIDQDEAAIRKNLEAQEKDAENEKAVRFPRPD